MREIKFRGKSINGDWYHGLLSESKGYNSQPEKGFYISNSAGMPWAYQIRPETIGQFTGLRDENGKEIYEGDIVQYQHIKAKIIYEHCSFCFEWIDGTTGIIRQRKTEPIFKNVNIIFEVIGNIYENPEQL